MAAKPEHITAPGYAGPDRRDGNGNGWTSLAAWGRFIGYVGLPGALCGFLVYILGTNVPEIVKQQVIIIQQQQLLAKQNEEVKAMQAQLIRVAQWHCYLVAKTDDGRKACYDK